MESTFKSAGTSVQSTTGRRAMRISPQGLYCSCKPAFCNHVTLTGYPTPFSRFPFTSLVRHRVPSHFTGLYQVCERPVRLVCQPLDRRNVCQIIMPQVCFYCGRISLQYTEFCCCLRILTFDDSLFYCERSHNTRIRVMRFCLEGIR